MIVVQCVDVMFIPCKVSFSNFKIDRCLSFLIRLWCWLEVAIPLCLSKMVLVIIISVSEVLRMNGSYEENKEGKVMSNQRADVKNPNNPEILSSK